MLRRTIIVFCLTLLPAGTALALPAAPAQSGSYKVQNALLDKVTASGTAKDNRTQGVLGYILDFHDTAYQYSLPACADAALVEQTGKTIEPTALNAGESVTISIRPNQATPAKSCIERLVRQQLTRSSSGGECLQGYQVKHKIESAPEQLLIKTEYLYQLTIYNRPTLDCDAEAYGASPITTTVAAGKTFTIWLDRKVPEGARKELKRWSLTTNELGKLSIPYTFTVATDSYQFHVAPAGNAVAGDVISWDAKVVDPHPSPSPSPAAPAQSSMGFPFMPVVAILTIILLGAIGAEYWSWVKRKRARQLPEQEYQRIPKL